MLDFIFKGLQTLIILVLYSALISFLFPPLYDYVKDYTKKGKRKPIKDDLNFVNTFIVQLVFLLTIFILYAIFFNSLINKDNY